jgi:HlyD family type I secretion membrane fusion protein
MTVTDAKGPSSGTSSGTSQLRWTAWLPLAVGFGAIALLIGAIGIWSVRTQIAGAIIANGMIQVENNRQVIQHPQGGVVGEILAKDGDRVTAGDVVLRLDGSQTRSELTIIEGQLHEILARKARLVAERDGLDDLAIPPELAKDAASDPGVQDLIDGQRRLFWARNDSLARENELLTEQITQTENQIAGAKAQRVGYDRQHELVTIELTDSQTLLNKGLMQASRVHSLEREQARLTGEIGELDATSAQLRGEIAGLGIQRLKLGTGRREEAISTLRDLQYQEIELVERRLSTRETLSRLDIRSPVSGIVYGSQIFAIQAVVSAADPIMYVIPKDQPLLVSARVDAIHVDQVHIGQDATLRFTSFDQRFTPEVFGHVAKISADVYKDEVTGASYYVAEILPNDGEIHKLGQVELLPGMPVEAFIRTEDRTPLSYLLKPMTDYFHKAFRES